MTQRHCDDYFKAIVIGSSGVGKTSFMRRQVTGQFDISVTSTHGFDFYVTTQDVDGKQYKIQLWDTAGQEQYRSMGRMMYNGVDAVILMYDVADRQSVVDFAFNVRADKPKSERTDWLGIVHDNVPEHAVKMIVGNKYEPANTELRKVQKTIFIAKNMAESHNYMHKVISVKLDNGIDDVIETIVRQMAYVKQQKLIALQNKGGFPILPVRAPIQICEKKEESKEVPKESSCSC